MKTSTAIANCRYCNTDDVYLEKHSGLWKIKCNEQYCLVVQCCDTYAQAIERWNEINNKGDIT